MSSDDEIKNTSLTLLDRKSVEAVPLRNAISSVKRFREPVRQGRLSFKPIRLDELTQEWLEAENEPLRKVSEYEDIKDSDTDTENEDKKSVEGLENVMPKFHIESPKKCDLGVMWLETPAKTQIHVKNEALCTITPKIRCGAKSASASPGKQEFVTPYTVKTVKNDQSTSKPKILYSMDIKGMLRTPLNNGTKHNHYSFSKEMTPQNPVFKNISNNDGTLSQEINAKQIKPSIKCTTILHEKNNENERKVVQFSLPATEIRDGIFKEIKVKKVTYIILNELGRGGSSVVYHCYDLTTKTECAIKKVNLGNEATAVGYINEVKVLERLQKCDRIIKMFNYELLESEKLLLVVLERGGSNLSNILKDLTNSNKHLPMHVLFFYWMEMLYAVKQIHQYGIIHSDLKPGNFLQAEGVLKLIDFGIASCVQDDMTSAVKNVLVGSFNYISPEALKNDASNNCDSPSFGKPQFKVNYKSDVWSLGCILYQLVYRRTPFQHIGHMWAKLSAIVDPEHEIDYPEVDWVPSKIVNTIKKCLQYDVRARPSVDELIHEYENIYN